MKKHYIIIGEIDRKKIEYARDKSARLFARGLPNVILNTEHIRDMYGINNIKDEDIKKKTCAETFINIVNNYIDNDIIPIILSACTSEDYRDCLEKKLKGTPVIVLIKDNILWEGTCYEDEDDGFCCKPEDKI